MTMKKLIFAMAALAALSLLAPAAGFAQLDLTARNQIGIYTDADCTSASVDLTSVGMLDAYIVVTNPYSNERDEPVSALTGYELGLTIPGDNAGFLQILSMNIAVPGLNIGNSTNHLVGFGSPALVVDNKLHVSTLSLFYSGSGQDVAIHMTTATPASIEGVMCLLEAVTEDLIPVYPSSGSFENPVFAINASVTATDVTSFDNIKAMYR
ncbi:hypothetical protein CSA17_06085 [bacterium DOLJORAL78_65_58]|nr:MAG: hypothetical protein CSB20_13495 [bacterium DOLZORAL124_64_63]PIE75703.1 MAG: hypothetical protein CSA17_06085 [bacterium DOLJORAL78_65_58]